MFNGATVTLAGYVATEPIYRTVGASTPLVSMRVAWSSRYVDRVTGEWRDGRTSFANVKCWRGLANNVAPSLRKGEAVVVSGRLQIQEYEDRDGHRRIGVDIEADAIGHDLSRGITHFQRTLRPAGGDPAGHPDAADGGEPLAAGPLAGDDPEAAGLFDQDAVESLVSEPGELAGAAASA